GPDGGDDDGGGGGGDARPIDAFPEVCLDVTCSGHGTCFAVDGAATCQCDGGYVRTDATTCEAAVGPTLGGCPLLPADHLFNTPIDALPVHPDSDAFIATIGGTRRVHLDLGTTTDQQDPEFYGIPFNLVHGGTFTWPTVAFLSTDPDLDWNPRVESDCAVGAGHSFVAPCTSQQAPAPLLPIPAGVVVEGGVNSSVDQQPYGDHHILLLDVDTCRLWETYHSYSPGPGTWNIYGAAGWDLTSNALRPDGWTSADAAGFPILPLLLRADEAATGEIKHALRFTIQSSKIRTSYVWPARHLTGNGTGSTSLPPMGQLFRLKADYAIPSGAGVQARAVLQALKTYGMYIADGGSDMYVQGDPSAAWTDDTFAVVQAVPASAFEAVDLAPIMARPGWDVDSGAVP
ncbi:MAG: hypothetical protein KC464_21000, partial [Myxococcales bacterium]|nr:hypothetical protein [Myxococcales bacterium]